MIQEQDLARRITRQLDQGLAEIRPGIAYRLRLAREAALDRSEGGREFALQWAWAGGHAPRGLVRFLSPQYLLPVALLLLGLLGVGYWQTTSPSNEVIEIDTALLTDDLPLNAYLDSGFEAWLKRSQPQ